MIRLGGPVFMGAARAAGAGESHGGEAAYPVLLARKHREKGFRAAYAPKVRLNETDRIREIRAAFAAEDIMLAEVGYWDNLIDTEPETRRRNRQCMLEALALAEELGARCAVDIFGSYCHGNGNSQHAAANFSQAAFDEAVELARYFIDAVKPKTACFTYEIFPFNIVDSPEMIAKLIRAVDRKQFGVHLDLVNLINCPRAYWSSGGIMRACAKLFGKRIVAAHAKDIQMESPALSVILREVRPGMGNLNYAAYLGELARLPQEVPLMLEHLSSEEEYDLAGAYLRQVATETGVSL